MGNKKRVRAAILLAFAILLGGCSTVEHEERSKKDNEDSNESDMNAYEKENFIPIQQYNGDGYKLRDANEENGKIAMEHEDEIKEAVKVFFKKKYSAIVKVHNIVSARDGVSVFVESEGEPHFHTFAVVPVDMKERKVRTDDIFTQEGQVETAIKSGLYAMAYKEQFEHLDKLLKSLTASLPVTGTPQEAVDRVNSNGFATTEYYLNVAGKTFANIYEAYMANPNISADELKGMLEKGEIDLGRAFFTVYLYMKDSGKQPDPAAFDEIVNKIEEEKELPIGSYTILLNDHYIDKRRAIGKKDNTLIKREPDDIKKTD